MIKFNFINSSECYHFIGDMQRRQNPFDRQANVDIPNADVIESESLWSRLLR